MNTMNFLLGVMGSGSAAFVGLSAYAVVEARRSTGNAHSPIDAVKAIEKPIETPAPAPVAVPVPVEVPVVKEESVQAPVAEEAAVPVPPVLEMGYWPIRGLAAPMRMMLEYAGVQYQDQQYDGQTWFGKVKPEAAKSNALINLPYVKDGDSYVTQSNACLQYLGAKLGLDPKDVLDPAAVTNSQVLNEIFDLRNSIIAVSYPFAKVTRNQEEYEANRATQLAETVPKFYTKLEAHLSQKETPFFSAAAPMSADFHVWEMLDQHEALARSAGAESPLTAYPKLHSFYTTFRALPQLEKYFSSEAYQLPINNKSAGAYFA